MEEALHNNTSNSSEGETNWDNIRIPFEKPKILSLTADFIMGDTKQLWLAYVSNVTIKSTQHANNLTRDLHRKRTEDLTRVLTPSLILPSLFSNTDSSLKDHSQYCFVDDRGG